MTEECGELIKCSCCKCFDFERFYELNRLGKRYKTCNKCRSKRITYQGNFKKKNKYNIIENSNDDNIIGNSNDNNIIVNSNDSNLTFCKKCNEYVCKEEAEYNEITGNTVCILCIMNYQESKLKMLSTMD
tara:strand:- start:49 stop:438 length:390 start_codon:yes stop_codon:yes gene_type:complete